MLPKPYAVDSNRVNIPKKSGKKNVSATIQHQVGSCPSGFERGGDRFVPRRGEVVRTFLFDNFSLRKTIRTRGLFLGKVLIKHSKFSIS